MKEYIKDLYKVKILSHKESLKMYKLMKQGDIQAKNNLIESSLRLIMLLLKKRFDPNKSYFEDLIQDSSLHICKIIDQWNPSRGKLCTLITNAVHNMITQKQFQYFTQIYVPEYTYKIAIDDNKEELEKLCLNRRLDVISAQAVLRSVSVNPDGVDDSVLSEYTIDNFFTFPNSDRKLTNKQLEKILGCISVRERDMLNLYFVDGIKLRSIGVKYGICRERVRQIIQQTLSNLRLIAKAKFQIS